MASEVLASILRENLRYVLDAYEYCGCVVGQDLLRMIDRTHSLHGEAVWIADKLIIEWISRYLST